MTEQKYAFSDWCPWDNFSRMPWAKRGGVYIIARFTNPPKKAADPSLVEIVYIGKSKRALGKRLKEFERAVYADQKKNHNGGTNFMEIFQSTLKGVFVAAHTPTVDDELLDGVVRKIESQLVQQYLIRWSGRPPCNKEVRF